MWVVINGDFFEGFQGVVGPFDTQDEAEDYLERHNMGHFTKAAIELEEPVKE